MSGWYDEPSVILSGGPVRVDVSDPDPEFVPRPVGFLAMQVTTAQFRQLMAEGAAELERQREADGVDLRMPLLWEGDQA